MQTRNGTYIETEHRIHERGTVIRGRISDKDLSFRPAEIIAQVREELSHQLACYLLDKIAPAIDKLVREAFTQEEEPTEGAEK